ncbi:MAG: alpha-amylase/4-alpha-glucanotransferase domain-containing protein [Candidatus Omnitrophota bacterium]
MNEAYLSLAFHLHQPVGNFESVIERAYQNCYLPFINLFSEFPEIKFSLHISGCLLDYLEVKHSDFLSKLKGMAACGQLELISGGYYEPILIAIPEADVLGQIKMLSKYIAKRFNYKPKGAWIPERVWRPELTTLLNQAKIKYCILDDTHFLKAGLKKEELYGYFLTGRGKEKLAVFPSDKHLRYSIPFAPVSEVFAYFAEVAQTKAQTLSKRVRPLLTYGDDAEKFGEWPGTYKWVYEEKWLINFLSQLRKNSPWFKTVHFSDYLETYPALGEIEIPESSYDEMLEWTGGSWLNFLKKYPEADQMHKKMFYVSRKISSTLAKTKADADKLREAKHLLYRGQCNCAYWHGVFGGLYLYHLRSAIYENLIAAEKIADEVIHKKEKAWQEVKLIDFDNDGKEEVIMESPSFSLCLDPQDGGVLKELDYRPQNINLINTLSRRPETYHKKILELLKQASLDKQKVHTIHDDIRVVDSSISQKLIYDRFGRYCLRDHFLSLKTKQASFMENTFAELGTFAGCAYKVKEDKGAVILSAAGNVRQHRLELSKKIKLKSKQALVIEYVIKGDQACLTGRQAKGAVLFAVEFNFTLPFLNSDRYGYFSGVKRIAGLEEEGAIGGLASFGVCDINGGLGLNLNFSPRLYELWFFPVQTVSQSERSYELNFQCISIVLVWRLDFSKSKRYNPKINISLGTPPTWPKVKNFLFLRRKGFCGIKQNLSLS